MEKFKVVITETSEGITLEIVDIEKGERTGKMDLGKVQSGLTISGMSKFVLDKCKEIMRMTTEQRKQTVVELKDESPF